MPCSRSVLTLPIAQCGNNFRIQILAEPLVRGILWLLVTLELKGQSFPEDLFFPPVLEEQQWILWTHGTVLWILNYIFISPPAICKVQFCGRRKMSPVLNSELKARQRYLTNPFYSKESWSHCANLWFQ